MITSVICPPANDLYTRLVTNVLAVIPGKKIAVGMLLMFVSSKKMSTLSDEIPAKAPMAMFRTLLPLMPSFRSRGE